MTFDKVSVYVVVILIYWNGEISFHLFFASDLGLGGGFRQVLRFPQLVTTDPKSRAVIWLKNGRKSKK